MSFIIDLNNKNIIVTGAGSGIGQETSILLAKEGATVMMLDISAEGLAETASLGGERCHPIAIDLTDSTAVADTVAKTVADYGKLDGLVHCAGISSRKPLNVLSREGFSKVMDVNFYSFVELVKQCAKKKHFNTGGSIVVMSSISSIIGYKAKSEYCVSKAAVDAFVRCMAQELASQRIRINSIMPVGVDTPMGRRASDISENVGSNESNAIALVSPLEVANTIAFLLSNAAPSISGAAIPMMMPQTIDNQSISTPPTHLCLCESISYNVLAGKRVLLVSDGSGIDEAVLNHLVKCGAEVIQYRPSGIDSIEGDMKWLAAEYGKLDGMVYGIVHSDFRPLQFVKPDLVNEITTDNYGLFVELMRCLKKCKILNNSASIVALSSISSIRAMKAKMAFCASKAALDAAVRCLAVELAPQGIRVNTIQKGAVDADIAKAHIQDVMAVRDEDTNNSNQAPLGMTSADEIAHAVAFMLSDSVKTMTGTTIVIDGGYTA